MINETNIEDHGMDDVMRLLMVNSPDEVNVLDLQFETSSKAAMVAAIAQAPGRINIGEFVRVFEASFGTQADTRVRRLIVGLAQSLISAYKAYMQNEEINRVLNAKVVPADKVKELPDDVKQVLIELLSNLLSEYKQ